jgi:hypothetical protein
MVMKLSILRSAAWLLTTRSEPSGVVAAIFDQRYFLPSPAAHSSLHMKRWVRNTFYVLCAVFVMAGAGYY